MADNIDKFTEHLRIAEIQIYLISTEGAPDMTLAVRSVIFCEQW